MTVLAHNAAIVGVPVDVLELARAPVWMVDWVSMVVDRVGVTRDDAAAQERREAERVRRG